MPAPLVPSAGDADLFLEPLLRERRVAPDLFPLRATVIVDDFPHDGLMTDARDSGPHRTASSKFLSIASLTISAASRAVALRAGETNGLGSMRDVPNSRCAP